MVDIAEKVREARLRLDAGHKISVTEPSDKMFDDFKLEICIVMSDDLSSVWLRNKYECRQN